MGSLEDNS